MFSFNIWEWFINMLDFFEKQSYILCLKCTDAIAKIEQCDWNF